MEDGCTDGIGFGCEGDALGCEGATLGGQGFGMLEVGTVPVVGFGLFGAGLGEGLIGSGCPPKSALS